MLDACCGFPPKMRQLSAAVSFVLRGKLAGGQDGKETQGRRCQPDSAGDFACSHQPSLLSVPQPGLPAGSFCPAHPASASKAYHCQPDEQGALAEACRQVVPLNILIPVPRRSTSCSGASLGAGSAPTVCSLWAMAGGELALRVARCTQARMTCSDLAGGSGWICTTT